jgi:hypothetical protein
MANPTLNWRYVGSVSFVSSISTGIDTVYSLGQNTTYADGSARTPGTGSAWTWNREVSGVTVAAYGVPPTNALGFSYIIGGTSGASAYTFLTPDTVTLVNCIVYGMNRSSGAYTTWTSATPFTSAGFSGYWRGTRAFSAVAYDSVSMWESQEGCILQWALAASGVTSTVGFGALFDPLSSAAGNAESDGRIYSMWGGGSTSNTASGWAGQGLASDGGAWATGNAAAGNTHAGTFAPGTAVMIGGAGAQTTRFGNFSPTNTFTSINGDIARVPVCLVSTGGNFLGQSRQWFLTKDAQSRLAWQNGATTIGYIWGSTTNSQTDAVVMTY